MFKRKRIAMQLAVAAATFLSGKAHAQAPVAATPETVAWFQATEQKLMGSIAPGDKTPWERVLDPSCVFTAEEGGAHEEPLQRLAIRIDGDDVASRGGVSKQLTTARANGHDGLAREVVERGQRPNDLLEVRGHGQ